MELPGHLYFELEAPSSSEWTSLETAFVSVEQKEELDLLTNHHHECHENHHDECHKNYHDDCHRNYHECHGLKYQEDESVGSS